jgi:hypothetical protein
VGLLNDGKDPQFIVLSLHLLDSEVLNNAMQTYSLRRFFVKHHTVPGGWMLFPYKGLKIITDKIN